MVGRGIGHILTITSDAGKRVNFYFIIYSFTLLINIFYMSGVCRPCRLFWHKILFGRFHPSVASGISQQWDQIHEHPTRRRVHKIGQPFVRFRSDLFYWNDKQKLVNLGPKQIWRIRRWPQNSCGGWRRQGKFNKNEWWPNPRLYFQTVLFALSQPAHVAVNEVLIEPQAAPIWR